VRWKSKYGRRGGEERKRKKVVEREKGRGKGKIIIRGRLLSLKRGCLTTYLSTPELFH
jgi:hypothetical protein